MNNELFSRVNTGNISTKDKFHCALKVYDSVDLKNVWSWNTNGKNGIVGISGTNEEENDANLAEHPMLL